MLILRGMLGKVPSGPKGRVRNFIANKKFGTQSDIHENVISPGVIVPWHFHETEEVIVVLEGNGECRTDEGAENYSAGDIIIFPPRVKHSLKNSCARRGWPGQPAPPPRPGGLPATTSQVRSLCYLSNSAIDPKNSNFS
jgi:hypothetical protein